MKNDMIISWILNPISAQISNSLGFVNTTFYLSNELQEHCSQLDGHRRINGERDQREVNSISNEVR